jgi:hypothetical protein
MGQGGLCTISARHVPEHEEGSESPDKACPSILCSKIPRKVSVMHGVQYSRRPVMSRGGAGSGHGLGSYYLPKLESYR